MGGRGSRFGGDVGCQWLRQTGRRFWANAVIPVYFGEITPQDAVTEYQIPVQSVPSDFVTGPDGNI
jgi:hypothetical protein